jgi:hypothetical protein
MPESPDSPERQFSAVLGELTRRRHHRDEAAPTDGARGRRRRRARIQAALRRLDRNGPVQLLDVDGSVRAAGVLARRVKLVGTDGARKPRPGVAIVDGDGEVCATALERDVISVNEPADAGGVWGLVALSPR